MVNNEDEKKKAEGVGDPPPKRQWLHDLEHEDAALAALRERNRKLKNDRRRTP
jgi:hypothetical protein